MVAGPAVGLLIAGVAVKEGLEAWRGEGCCVADPARRRRRSTTTAATMTAARTDAPQKAIVRRLVEEVMNGRRLEVIDELCSPAMARRWRAWVVPFLASFPDMRMEIGQLVEEGDTVVGRFTCSATHTGQWGGHAPTERRFEDVDEVYFFGFEHGRISAAWGLEDTLDRLRQLGLADS